MVDDEKLYDEAMTANEESFPSAVVDALLAGENPVKVFREHRGMSQADLASKANIDPAYLVQIESGTLNASKDVAQKLALALCLETDDLEQA